MNENLTGRILWNEAGKVGAVLGAICVTQMLLSIPISLLSGNTLLVFLGSVLSFLLWIAKLVGCIWVMRYFMLKLAINYPEADNTDCRKLGTASALLSALIVAAASMANLIFISGDATQVAIAEYMGKMPLDSNSMAAVDSMVQNLPTITFFSTLIYCFLYGWILSAILSSKIPSDNPFND